MSLNVIPSLPFKHPLYLSVTPRFAAQFLDKERYGILLRRAAYQLDECSLKKLKDAVRIARPSIPVTLDTGHDDALRPEWETWSSQTPRETSNILYPDGKLPLYFDLVPFETLSSRALVKPRIYDEVALLRQ